MTEQCTLITEWISVDDTLPEAFHPVLAYRVSTRMVIAQTVPRSGELIWKPEANRQRTLEDITHWKPLPEPPHTTRADGCQCEVGIHYAGDPEPKLCALCAKPR